ncbi:hypothetical protein QR680_002925 [Steinernema hermaphroditum]|uniref:Uncharacterized protein n=1 Tax=Steinernema hermaphroditum TaxID=289476 RepID=A0AA39LJ54_9BILA|nr:hypothetical protein QR680_002925 [Steinernema hermaphroditum]
MISVAVDNKDRLTVIWPVVERHLQWLMKDFGQNPLIVERVVVGLLRLTGRVLYHLNDKDEDGIADNALQSLSMLLSLKPPLWFMFSRRIAYGLQTAIAKSTFWRTVRRCVYVYCGIEVIGTHVGEVLYCTGVSMYRTILHSGLGIAERLLVKLGNVHRVDIVNGLAHFWACSRWPR